MLLFVICGLGAVCTANKFWIRALNDAALFADSLRFRASFPA